MLVVFECQQVKEKASYQSHVEKEAEEKKRGAEKPTNHSFSFFPPVPPPPPPPQSGSVVKLTLIFIRIINDRTVFFDTVSPSSGPCALHASSSSSSSVDVGWQLCRRQLQYVDAVVHLWLLHGQLPGEWHVATFTSAVTNSRTSGKWRPGSTIYNSHFVDQYSGLYLTATLWCKLVTANHFQLRGKKHSIEYWFCHQLPRQRLKLGSIWVSLKWLSNRKCWTPQDYIQSKRKEAISCDVTSGDANVVIHAMQIMRCGVHPVIARSWKHWTFGDAVSQQPVSVEILPKSLMFWQHECCQNLLNGHWIRHGHWNS